MTFLELYIYFKCNSILHYRSVNSPLALYICTSCCESWRFTFLSEVLKFIYQCMMLKSSSKINHIGKLWVQFHCWSFRAIWVSFLFVIQNFIFIITTKVTMITFFTWTIVWILLLLMWFISNIILTTVSKGLQNQWLKNNYVNGYVNIKKVSIPLLYFSRVNIIIFRHINCYFFLFFIHAKHHHEVLIGIKFNKGLP